MSNNENNSSNGKIELSDLQSLNQGGSRLPSLSSLPEDSKKPEPFIKKSKFGPKTDSNDNEVTAPEINIEIISEPLICQSCKRPFIGYETRTGINIFLMILIIILSVLIIPILLAFIFLCKTYYVCPNCRKFTGFQKQKTNFVCLC